MAATIQGRPQEQTAVLTESMLRTKLTTTLKNNGIVDALKVSGACLIYFGTKYSLLDCRSNACFEIMPSMIQPFFVELDSFIHR